MHELQSMTQNLCPQWLLSKEKVKWCSYPAADLPYRETVYAPAVLESLTMKPPSLSCRGRHAVESLIAPDDEQILQPNDLFSNSEVLC